MLKVTNINWDIDMDEVYEKLDEMTAEKAAKVLEVPADKYANMTSSERHDYAYDVFRHCPGRLYEFLELPESLELSDEYDKDQDVVDYLSDKYGYCIKSLSVETIFNDGVMKKLFGNKPLPDFESSAELLGYMFDRVVEAVKSGEMSLEDLEGIPFATICGFFYRTHLDVPMSIASNRDKQVLLDYIRDHLPEANIESEEVIR